MNKILSSGLLNEEEVKTFHILVNKKKRATKMSQQDYILASKLYQNINSVKRFIIKPNMNIWAAVINKLREEDGVSAEIITTLIEHIFKDKFWSGVIIDAYSLRKHANRLITQFNINTRKQTYQTEAMFDVNNNFDEGSIEGLYDY